MKINFKNKSILVTGGTRGIGKSLVIAFSRAGGNVFATGTNIEEIGCLNIESIIQNVKYVHLNYSDKDSISKFIDQFPSLGQIDVLINNSGVNKIDAIHNIEMRDWDWLNEVNLKGPFLMSKLVSESMMASGGGRIINIASIFGVVSKAKRAAYSTTKWGLIGFTKAIALDLASYGILVNAVSPGFVDTELTRRILGATAIGKLKQDIPLGRMAEPDEIAKIVLFLASDQNSYITGQNIVVDGGFTCA